MRNALWKNSILGYCTNVHPATTLQQLRTNLDSHCTEVRKNVSGNGTLGVGLWLPNSVTTELLNDAAALSALRDLLQELQLLPFTANAFPFGDFHQDVVKTAVYQPDWTSPERMDYTIDVCRCMATLAPDEHELSISTLPLGFGIMTDQQYKQCARQLSTVVRALEQLESETGVCCHVDIEPEPGCVMDRSHQLVEFMTRYLDDASDHAHNRRYVRVCHDVCHAAVMNEPQRSMFNNYDDAGIQIGKVQISSAIRVRWDDNDNRRQEQLCQLTAFAEDRYLHQTMVIANRPTGPENTLHLDLADALEDASPQSGDEWRIHFHVPIFADSAGALDTTRSDIEECLALCRDRPEIQHFEVETYAWNVLPESLATTDLAAGIAAELDWVIKIANPQGSAT